MAEVALPVEQTDANERNIQIGRALDVIAGEDAEAARIDRKRLVQAELGREVPDRAGTQHASVRGAPRGVGRKVLALAAIGVVDPAVQCELAGPLMERGEWYLRQERNRIVLEFSPAGGRDLSKETGRIDVPTPPEVSREGPELLLAGLDELVEAARFGDDRRHLRRRRGERLDLLFREDAGLAGLDDQGSLEHAVLDDGDTEQRLEGLFACFTEVLEARVRAHLIDGDGSHLLGDQTDEPFVKSQA